MDSRWPEDSLIDDEHELSSQRSTSDPQMSFECTIPRDIYVRTSPSESDDEESRYHSPTLPFSDAWSTRPPAAPFSINFETYQSGCIHPLSPPPTSCAGMPLFDDQGVAHWMGPFNNIPPPPQLPLPSSLMPFSAGPIGPNYSTSLCSPRTNDSRRNMTAGHYPTFCENAPLTQAYSSAQPSLSIPYPSVPYRVVGPPSLQIFQSCLPTALVQRLDCIRILADKHAATLPNGWNTNMFSLTKQDMAISDIPGAREVAQPVIDFIKFAVESIASYHKQYPVFLEMDRNQPHVLKYDVHHCNVPLHHDSCDITINLLLSCPQIDFTGGGTYIQACHSAVYLQKGEFLAHPGHLIHAGQAVTSGTRYLLIFFCKIGGSFT